jgi:hypothetical protein
MATHILLRHRDIPDINIEVYQNGGFEHSRTPSPG